MGGFTESVDDSGLSSRERIATLLFDKEQGIGLTCYRFNLGAGSAESRKGSYSDIHRRAQSFEVSEGVYDFDKDANAVWFVEKAGELELLETAAAVLDVKRSREELTALLDELADQLAARAARDGDRRRLLRAAELVKTLQGAAMLNVNGGQIAGWLCAGMFTAM